jgi:twinkle protein
MSCIEKLPHEKCGSGDGLQVFEEDGVYTGYCFACGTYIPYPYWDKPADYKPKTFNRSDEEIEEDLTEIRDRWGVLDLPERALMWPYLDYFNVKVGVSQADGETPESVAFPYGDNGYKMRLLDHKKMWFLGTRPDELDPTRLFGWQQAVDNGGRKLFITEGEFDAVALFQTLKEQAIGTDYEHINPAVVSIPDGAGSAVKTLSVLLKHIHHHFKEVALVFDMDDAGREAAEDVIKKVCPQWTVAQLPAKDVNACLLEGRERACKSAVLFKASSPKNTRILLGSQFTEQAMAKPEMGKPWPWEGLTEATRGRRRGETLYFGAGVKMGKSELVNAIGADIIARQDSPVLFIKPEESPVKTYQLLVGKVANRIFHDPTVPFDEEAYLAAEPRVRDKALITDIYQFAGWDTVRQDIVHAVSLGVKDVMIDPITCFTNQMSSAAANEHLVSLSAELSVLAKDLDFTAYIFCHLKAPEGTPHERGGSVLSTQFAGSRAMMRTCNYMIGLEGNKDPELPLEERNIRTLVLLEDREFGITARIPLYWDHKTGAFNEV